MSIEEEKQRNCQALERAQQILYEYDTWCTNNEVRLKQANQALLEAQTIRDEYHTRYNEN